MIARLLGYQPNSIIFGMLTISSNFNITLIQYSNLEYNRIQRASLYDVFATFRDFPVYILRSIYRIEIYALTRFMRNERVRKYLKRIKAST